jgi:transposase
MMSKEIGDSSAAQHAFRRCPVLGAFRSRLVAAGKPVKAALTATARKLLGVLNAMLTTGTDYSQTTPV